MVKVNMTVERGRDRYCRLIRTTNDIDAATAEDNFGLLCKAFGWTDALLDEYVMAIESAAQTGDFHYELDVTLEEYLRIRDAGRRARLVADNAIRDENNIALAGAMTRLDRIIERLKDALPHEVTHDENGNPITGNESDKP